MTLGQIPYLRIVVGFCISAIVGYAFFSVYAVMWLKDPSLTGDIIGTWKSFAVAGFMFWIGSSSGGKGKDVQDKPVPENVEAAAQDTADAAQVKADKIKA
jgi:hypothetical protein